MAKVVARSVVRVADELGDDLGDFYVGTNLADAEARDLAEDCNAASAAHGNFRYEVVGDDHAFS